jgi:hypothetical protein
MTSRDLRVPDVQVDDKLAAWTHECSPTLRLALQSVRDRSISLQPFYCKSWSCSRCARYKADQILEHASHCFGQHEMLWCVWLRRTHSSINVGELRGRFKKRRERVQSKVTTRGEKVNYLIMEGRDWVVVISTHDMPGRGEPTQLVQLSSQSAINLLASLGVKVPGPRRKPSWSAGWKPTNCGSCNPPTRGPRKQLLAIVDEDEFQEAFYDAAAEAKQQYGTRPRLGLALPDKVPGPEWDRILERKLSPIRRGG